MSQIFLETRAAIGVLYGPEAAAQTRQTRRRAEKTLLGLRGVEANEAMQVCVALLSTPQDPAAVFAAQTVAFLCRTKEPGPEWAGSVVSLLRASIETGHARAVTTALSLGVCALVVRLKAWPASALIPAVANGIGDSAGSPTIMAALLNLLRLLPEEMENEQLAASEFQLDECREQLAADAAAEVVTLCVPMIQVGHSLAASALGCLSAWIKSSLLPWAALERAMQPALVVMVEALHVVSSNGADADSAAVALGRGCELLTAATARDLDGERIGLFVNAALSLAGGFGAVCREAARAHAAGESDVAVVSAAAALALMYADIGICTPPAAIGQHGVLLELLLNACTHPAPQVPALGSRAYQAYLAYLHPPPTLDAAVPQVASPVLGFWARAGEAVVRAHPAAAQPLLNALVGAATYPVDYARLTEEIDGYDERSPDRDGTR